MSHFDQALHEAAQWAVELKDNPNASNQAQFEAWLNRHSDNHRAWQKIQQVQSHFNAMHHAPAQEVLHKTPERSLSRRDFVRRLALFGGVTAGAGWFTQDTQMGHWLTNLNADQHTAIGEQRQINTSSGSVWLNTVSAANFQKHTTHLICELLNGELVATANTSTPLKLHCDDMKIHASQAQIALRRIGYGHYRISVLNGEVQVTSGLYTQVLGAQQTLTLSDNHPPQLSATQPYAFSWIEGRLTVEDLPLQEVISELNRYHYGYIHVSSSLHHRVTGSLPLNSLKSALTLLENTVPIQVFANAPFLTIIQAA